MLNEVKHNNLHYNEKKEKRKENSFFIMFWFKICLKIKTKRWEIKNNKNLKLFLQKFVECVDIIMIQKYHFFYV